MKKSEAFFNAAVNAAVSVIISFAICCLVCAGFSPQGLAPFLTVAVFTVLYLLTDKIGFIRERKLLKTAVLLAGVAAVTAALIVF